MSPLRDLARTLSLGVFVSLVACGGSVAKLGSGDSGNPNLDCPTARGVTQGGTCPNNGQTCTGTVSGSECGGPPSTITVQCTCNDEG